MAPTPAPDAGPLGASLRADHDNWREIVRQPGEQPSPWPRHRGPTTTRSRLAAALASLAILAASAPVVAAADPSNAGTHFSALAVNHIIDVGPAGFNAESETSDTVNGTGDDQFRITVAATQAITVTVADRYIVGDNYTVKLDGNAIGTTPPVDLYGPAYSTGTFPMTLQPGTHLITIEDPGAIHWYNLGNTFMIPAGYLVTIAFVNASGPTILFVHGIKANYANPDLYKGLLDPLKAAFGSDSVKLFEFYYDTSCDFLWGDVPAKDPAAAGLPTDSTPTDCASMSDLGANALLLDAKIRNLFAQTGHPIILIGNSMGAAITRGMLAYSLQISDGVANHMIDSIFYMQGAQQGSIILSNLSGTQPPRDIAGAAASLFLATYFNFAGSASPALFGLTPKSPYYTWVNSPGRVANIPTFNFYGDINVAYTHCDFFVVNCHLDVNNPTNYGDILLLPGDSNPTATPVGGGAKYLNGQLGPNNFQWGLHYFYGGVSPGGETLVTDLEVLSNLWNTSPASHNAFEGKIATTTVPDCVTGEQTTIPTEILRIITGRANGTPVQCQAQWGDQ